MAVIVKSGEEVNDLLERRGGGNVVPFVQRVRGSGMGRAAGSAGVEEVR